MATQTTSNTASTTYLNKTYIDRELLALARTQFKHAKFGQKRPIPKNNGKHVEFRRWELFDPKLATNGLAEGVTPASQDLAQTRVEATVKQYGAFVEISDLLDMTAIDDAMEDSVELLGEQLGTVLEWVTRDAMCSGNSVQYAGGNTSRLALDATDKLTVEEIRKAVRTLKKNKARPFNSSDDGKSRRPHYICICSPDATYDLQNDQLWQDVSKYSNAEQIYSGEIGRLFGVVFVESTEAKVFTDPVNNKVNAGTTNSDSFVLKEDPTEEEVEYLSTGGSDIYIAGTKHTLADTGSYTVATKAVKMSAAASLDANAAVIAGTAGAAGVDVHATLIFGKEAYGTIDLGSTGAVRSIIKPFGHGDDPLDQRATVGAKIAAYTAKVLNDNWIIRIEHGVSA